MHRDLLDGVMSALQPNTRTCLTCKYAEAGNCHRFPPQMTFYLTDNQHPIMYMPDAAQPLIRPSDWCGEWVKAVMT